MCLYWVLRKLFERKSGHEAKAKVEAIIQARKGKVKATKVMGQVARWLGFDLKYKDYCRGEATDKRNLAAR